MNTVRYARCTSGNWRLVLNSIKHETHIILLIIHTQRFLKFPLNNVESLVTFIYCIWAIWAMTPDGKGQSQLFAMEGSPDGAVGTDEFASRGWAEERISWIK